MPAGAVSWRDYQGMADFGGLFNQGDDGYSQAHTSADVDALNKALTAGSAIDNPGSSPGEGFPLRVESLDQTLFNTTYAAKDIKFWKMLSKQPAYNTIE